MPFDSIADSAIDQDSPLKETAVMKAGRNRDRWNWEEASNGGAGIEPSVTAFRSALVAHSHDGTDGQGENIDTDGIAAGAVSDPDMFEDDSISAGKIASNTMQTGNLGTAAVTAEKMNGRMGWPVSGSQAYDTTLPPRAGIDELYEGDTLILSNPKGGTGVLGNFTPTFTHTPTGGVDWHCKDMTPSSIYFHLVTYFGMPTSGTWHVECRIM